MNKNILNIAYFRTCSAYWEVAGLGFCTGNQYAVPEKIYSEFFS
ncbi:hypothetical protein COLINT_02128 [Collinsella intestinalis DSM 13280]|uniref:Uncharacterized protein n=1 Tax=Collinsella intestinalis DSM 13280 TaxID=521003 RepID=C4F7W3_9ACTN|nr:hypothetical protein COLINT_02128 [Collinsella intestinalis DSM 13280]